MPTGYTVFKEECTQCYDSDESPTGLDLCLTCFNGGCTTAGKQHSTRHHTVASHPIVCNIKKIEVEKPQTKTDETAPATATATAAPAPTTTTPAATVTKTADGKTETALSTCFVVLLARRL